VSDDQNLIEFDLAEENERLKDSLYRALRATDLEKGKKADLVEAVYRGAVDGARSLHFEPVQPPGKDKRKKSEEYAVAVLSDWQLAKVTPDYNSLVCEERVERYAKKVMQLTDIQRADHPVKKLRVYILGDIVEGELIFPGQAHLIDASLYRQVTVDGPRIMGNFLRKMLTHFEEVHVVAVIGNHGALGGKSRRDYDPETNADRMLYRIVQHIFADETRITWEIPDGGRERNWYAVDRIGDAFEAFLFHGDQIKGQLGFPWYGYGKKVQGWANGAVPEISGSTVRHREFISGHFHQAVVFPLNMLTVRVNGSTESQNTYAIEQLAATGRPCQWLLFVHPMRGLSAEYRVWLDLD
jgi:hypothetical protein